MRGSRFARCRVSHLDSVLTFACPRILPIAGVIGSGTTGLYAHLGTSNIHTPMRVWSRAARPQRCARTERDRGSPKTMEYFTSGTLQPMPAASVAHNMRYLPDMKPSQHPALEASEPSEEKGWTQSRRCSGSILRRVRTTWRHAFLLWQYSKALLMSSRLVAALRMVGRMCRMSRTGSSLFSRMRVMYERLDLSQPMVIPQNGR